MGNEQCHQVFVDGSSIGNPGLAGIGMVLKDPQGKTLVEQHDHIGICTNNVAEYRALILGMTEALRQGVKQLEVLTDSELIANQMKGRYKIKDATLKQFHGIAKHLSLNFSKLQVRHISREHNKTADSLARQGSQHKSSSIKLPHNI